VAHTVINDFIRVKMMFQDGVGSTVCMGVKLGFIILQTEYSLNVNGNRMVRKNGLGKKVTTVNKSN
jgi:hypothetical protein